MPKWNSKVHTLPKIHFKIESAKSWWKWMWWENNCWETKSKLQKTNATIQRTSSKSNRIIKWDPRIINSIIKYAHWESLIVNQWFEEEEFGECWWAQQENSKPWNQKWITFTWSITKAKLNKREGILSCTYSTFEKSYGIICRRHIQKKPKINIK